MKDSVLLGSFLTFIGFVILALACSMSFDAGENSILHSCERTSFFYLKDKTFECLPYTRGMLEIHPQPELVPR